MSFDRFSLSEIGFFYDEDVRHTAIPAAPLPHHVETLRQSMLDFACQDLDLASDEDAATQHLASRYSEGGYSDRHWEDFFRKSFFDPLVQNASVSRNDPRRVSRNKYYYDAIEFDTDASWETFSGKAIYNDLGRPIGFENIRMPKPDYAFYLPMYHLTAECHIPGIADHKAREWNKAATPSLVESFSWYNLRELIKYGLHSSPFRVFWKGTRPPQEKDLKCYPWLIIEYKKEKYSPYQLRQIDDVVACHAANASASAVKLNQMAARYAIELADEAHVPPIPTVTTVGPKVKVWITYFVKDFVAFNGDKSLGSDKWKKYSQGYMMKCIWVGDMTHPHDVVKLRLILENTYTWATRVFKPLISTYLDQWTFVHLNLGQEYATAAIDRRRERMELFRSTVPLIKGAMSRQSSYEVDDSWHYRLTPMVMGILVRQICNAERKTLTQEIERIITDKIEALSFNSGGVPTPKPSQRTSTPSEDTQQATQAITINIGDTKDNGHIESQATASGTAESACFPPRDGLRQNAPLNPQFSSPQLDTPTRQILQAPRTTFREDSTPSRFSNTKKPKEQSGSYQPIPKSEDEWSTTSEDTDTENGLEDPCHSPSVPSSSIFTATTRRSAQSLTRGPSSPLDFSTSDTFQFRGIKSLNLPSYPGAN